MHPRPSNLGRMALCPGSYLLCLQIWAEKPVSSPITNAGTRIHKALKDQDFAKLDEDERDLAQRCQMYATELLERLGATRAYQQGFIVTTEIERELQLCVPREGAGPEALGEVIIDGTTDSLTRHQQPDGEHLIIIDFKTGYKVNLTSLSCQCGAYAAMGLQTFPNAIDCTVSGFYPRLRQDFTRVFTRADLPGLISSIQQMIVEAVHPESEIIFRPSAEACEYCPALSACPAARQSVFELEKALSKLDLTSMDSPKLGMLYDKLQLLDDVKSLVRQEIVDRCRRGDENTGYEATSKRGHRYIPDTAKAWERLGGVVSVEDFLACCEMRITRMEKTVPYAIKREKGADYHLEKAKQDMEILLGDAMQRKPPYIQLTRKQVKRLMGDKK